MDEEAVKRALTTDHRPPTTIEATVPGVSEEAGTRVLITDYQTSAPFENVYPPLFSSIFTEKIHGTLSLVTGSKGMFLF